MLIVIIYIAFVSLGLPDALIGTAWPVARADFGAPVSAAGIVSFIVVCGTVASSLLSARILKRVGPGWVTALSAVLTGSMIVLMSKTEHFWVLCLLAVPLGFGAGSVDTALNNFVALHYKASHMSFLHAAWGLGATVGPLLLARGIALSGWRSGYLLIGCLQLGLSLVFFSSLPLWKRFAKTDEASAVPIETSYRRALRLPMAMPVLASLFFTARRRFARACGRPASLWNARASRRSAPRARPACFIWACWAAASFAALLPCALAPAISFARGNARRFAARRSCFSAFLPPCRLRACCWWALAARPSIPPCCTKRPIALARAFHKP